LFVCFFFLGFWLNIWNSGFSWVLICFSIYEIAPLSTWKMNVQRRKVEELDDSVESDAYANACVR